MRHSNYSIIISLKNSIFLSDDGPHDIYLTITNDAEAICSKYSKQRIFYIDSDNQIVELKHQSGKFHEFDTSFHIYKNFKDIIHEYQLD